MKTIWVLGAGQLGAMLKQAGMNLSLDVRPVDIDDKAVPQLDAEDLVTAERELWPETPVTNKLATHDNFINLKTFARLADRKTQKQLIDSLGIATSPWLDVTTGTIEAELHEKLGTSVLLKRRTGGYDGKGQHWLKQPSDSIPVDWYGECIAEQGINFDEEVSLVGARDKQGNLSFYPLALNLHVDGVLTASVSPVPRLSALQKQAETMLSSLLNDLDYVGVMAMECFRIGDQLMINELAPRVHNSGHWTQSGASISQFELHLRALADLPIPSPWIKQQTVMINLLGTPFDTAWLAIDSASVHWYGKGVRPGRKLGHINLPCSNKTQCRNDLAALQNTLPTMYKDVMDWVYNALDD